MQQLSSIVGLLAAAFVFGTTVWFFFIQAPFLLARLGRERFVPIQMMATRVLGKTLVVGTLLMLGAALLAAATLAGGPPLSPFSPLVLSAAVALLGALVNDRVLIPRALKAGGRGHVEIRGHDKDASTAGFAADGVGAATATLHRLVVLFVVVMLAGVVPHLLILTSLLPTG